MPECKHNWIKLSPFVRNPSFEWCEKCGSLRKSFFDPVPSSYITKTKIYEELEIKEKSKEISEKIINNQKELPNEFARVLNEDFEDLVTDKNTESKGPS